MSERLKLPDPDCAAICSNAMNDVCIEECAAVGQCAFFKLRRDLTILTMPSYPDMQNKQWEARAVIRDAYLSKLIDHIQGKPNEPDIIPTRRSNTHHPRGEPLPENIQVENILFSAEKETTPSEAGKKHSSEG